MLLRYIIFLEIRGASIRIHAKRSGVRSKCPNCLKCSETVRSFYTRTLTDLPLVEYTVHFKMNVRRFACKNPKCIRRIVSVLLSTCFKVLRSALPLLA